MTTETDTLGSKKFRLGRTETHPNNVAIIVKLGSFDVDLGQRVRAIIEKLGNEHGENVFEGKVHKNRKAISIPYDTVREMDLKPGMSVQLTAFEPEEDESETMDNDEIISTTTTARADKTSSDGLDARLKSEIIYECIGPVKTEVEFENLRNGESTKALTKKNKIANGFRFPSKARQEIGAEPGDKIRVSVPRDGNTPELSEFCDGETDETLELLGEIHEIVWEIREAQVQ